MTADETALDAARQLFGVRITCQYLLFAAALDEVHGVDSLRRLLESARRLRDTTRA